MAKKTVLSKKTNTNGFNEGDVFYGYDKVKDYKLTKKEKDLLSAMSGGKYDTVDNDEDYRTLHTLAQQYETNDKRSRKLLDSNENNYTIQRYNTIKNQELIAEKEKQLQSPVWSDSKKQKIQSEIDALKNENKLMINNNTNTYMDTTGNKIWSTIGKITGGIANAYLAPGENIVRGTADIVADIGDKITGSNNGDKLRELYSSDNMLSSKYNNMISNLDKTSFNTNILGYDATQLPGNMVNTAMIMASPWLMYGSSGLGEYATSRENGATVGRSLEDALVRTGIDVITERIGGLIPGSAVSEQMKNRLIKDVVKDMFEEGGEEVAGVLLNALYDEYKDGKYDGMTAEDIVKSIGSEALTSAVGAALSTGVMGGATPVKNSINNIKTNIKTNSKTNVDTKTDTKKGKSLNKKSDTKIEDFRKNKEVIKPVEETIDIEKTNADLKKINDDIAKKEKAKEEKRKQREQEKLAKQQEELKKPTEPTKATNEPYKFSEITKSIDGKQYISQIFDTDGKYIGALTGTSVEDVAQKQKELWNSNNKQAEEVKPTEETVKDINQSEKVEKVEKVDNSKIENKIEELLEEKDNLIEEYSNVRPSDEDTKSEIAEQIDNIDKELEKLEKAKEVSDVKEDVKKEKVKKEEVKKEQPKKEKIKEQPKKEQPKEEVKSKKIETVEDKMRNSGIEFTDDEIYAVTNWSGFSSYGIQDAHRNNTQLDGINKKISDGLETALDKIPTVEKGTFERTLEISDDAMPEFLDKYKEGAVVTENQFTSMAKTGTYENEYGNVEWYITTDNAHDTETYMRPDEHEVMLNRGAKLRVDKVVKDGDIYKMYLTDVTNDTTIKEQSKEETKVEEKPKSINKSSEPDISTYKKNDLIDFARQATETYLQTGNEAHAKKALKFYNEYKKQGGKKTIDTLEQYVARQQEVKTEKKSKVLNAENLTKEEAQEALSKGKTIRTYNPEVQRNFYQKRADNIQNEYNRILNGPSNVGGKARALDMVKKTLDYHHSLLEQDLPGLNNIEDVENLYASLTEVKKISEAKSTPAVSKAKSDFMAHLAQAQANIEMQELADAAIKNEMNEEIEKNDTLIVSEDGEFLGEVSSKVADEIAKIESEEIKQEKAKEEKPKKKKSLNKRKPKQHEISEADKQRIKNVDKYNRKNKKMAFIQKYFNQWKSILEIDKIKGDRSTSEDYYKYTKSTSEAVGNITTYQTDLEGNVIGKSKDAIFAKYDAQTENGKSIMDYMWRLEYDLAREENVKHTGKQYKPLIADMNVKQKKAQLKYLKDNYPALYAIVKETNNEFHKMVINENKKSIEAGVIGEYTYVTEDFAKNVMGLSDDYISKHDTVDGIKVKNVDYLDKLNPWYIPTERDVKLDDSQILRNDIKGDGRQTVGTKKVKGLSGSNEIMLDSSTAATVWLFDRTRQNNLNVLANNINSTLKFDDISKKTLTKYEQENDISMTADGTATMRFYEKTKDGRTKERHVQIPSALYETLSRRHNDTILEYIDSVKDKAPMKVLAGANKILRESSTGILSPAYLVKNKIRDVQELYMSSDNSLSELPKHTGALALDMINDTPEFRAFAAQGGMDTYQGYEVGNRTLNKKHQTTIQKGVAKVEQINAFVEASTRYAAYKASLASGKSQKAAMLDAAKATTNFDETGWFWQGLDKAGVTVYLGASFAGANKAIDTFAMSPVRGVEAAINGVKNGRLTTTEKADIKKAIRVAAMSAITYGIGAGINGLFNDDDEKKEIYESLPSYIRDNNYVFVLNDGGIVTIPMGRQNSVVNYVINMATKDSYRPKDMEDIITAAEFVYEQVGPNSLDTSFTISGVIQGIMNKDHYGNEIGMPLDRARYIFDSYGGLIADVVDYSIKTSQGQNANIPILNTYYRSGNNTALQKSQFWNTIDKIKNSDKIEDQIKYKYLYYNVYINQVLPIKKELDALKESGADKVSISKKQKELDAMYEYVNKVKMAKPTKVGDGYFIYDTYYENYYDAKTGTYSYRKHK